MFVIYNYFRRYNEGAEIGDYKEFYRRFSNDREYGGDFTHDDRLIKSRFFDIFGHVFNVVLRAQPKSVLDVGCGNGINLPLSRVFPGVRFCAIDYAEKAVAAAGRQYPDVDFSVGDAFDMPYANGEFDLAILSNIMILYRDAEDQRRLLAETARTVAKDGVTVLIVWKNSWLHRFAVRLSRWIGKLRRQSLPQDFCGVHFSPREIRSIADDVGLEVLETHHTAAHYGAVEALRYLNMGKYNRKFGRAESESGRRHAQNLRRDVERTSGSRGILSWLFCQAARYLPNSLSIYSIYILAHRDGDVS